jgi:competence protein ComGC
MARAGFCSECKANQWLNEDGSCVNGHPASCVSGTYETGQPPVAGAPKKSHTGLVIGIAVAALVALFVCGILAAIAVPVFFNASGNAAMKSCFANERLVEGGAQVYLAENEGATLPSDFNGLMSLLVPSILKTVPKCPTGGVYSLTSTGSAVKMTCSVHGYYADSTSGGGTTAP